MGKDQLNIQFLNNFNTDRPSHIVSNEGNQFQDASNSETNPT